MQPFVLIILHYLYFDCVTGAPTSRPQCKLCLISRKNIDCTPRKWNTQMWNGEKPRQGRMWIFEECQLWWVCGWRDGEFGVIPLECQTSAELCMPSGACICQIRWYSGTFVTCTNKCVLLFCVDTQECYVNHRAGKPSFNFCQCFFDHCCLTCWAFG